MPAPDKEPPRCRVPLGGVPRLSIMPVRIKHIGGETDFFQEGDEIVEIDSHPIADQLDLLFNLPDEGSMLLTLERRGGDRVSRSIGIETFERADLLLEEMRFQHCRSRCTFCFVEQMPKGLRSALYEKDDDYRLSFLFGNFITLNDVTEGDIGRIIDMRLSPIYISVHAVDSCVRERLFGRPMRHDILELMERLASNGIAMHAQIVLVPGVNDGDVLEETVNELFGLYPGCRSVAIVPVGLTGHRDGLAPIEGVTEEEASTLVSWTEKKREGFRKETEGEFFLHLSDEFYLMSGRELPPAGDYDDFPQIANGVGMCRLFKEEIESEISRISGGSHDDISIAIVTGRLGAVFLERYVLPSIKDSLPWLEIELITVENRLFGDSVGVSGLLGGADIISAAEHSTSSCIILPPNALNHDGLLIDDMRPDELGSALGRPVIVPESNFLEEEMISACGRWRAT